MAALEAHDLRAPPGQLYTWGRGSDGQLGHRRRSAKDQCALPHPVPGLTAIVQVACGEGQQGCTAAVTADGALFTFGNNTKGRLGHSTVDHVPMPMRVEALVGVTVVHVACGEHHMLCALADGTVRAWGGNKAGELGDGTNQPSLQPVSVLGPDGAGVLRDIIQVDCSDAYSAAVASTGALFTWGCNARGKLGLGDKLDRPFPCQVDVDGVRRVSLGSLYAGAVTTGGELYMWGYGGHGNLGQGNRKSSASPLRVLGELADKIVTCVACTRAQSGCKGGLNPKEGGAEGPHSMATTECGQLYTWGTCHKGLLGNIAVKTGAFGKPWDELLPYRVGGPLRDVKKGAPLQSLPRPTSQFAVWPPPYDSVGPFTAVASAHIHCAALNAAGELYAWGCGSNDGRCGVERFLNGPGGRTDAMKCYMMGPHRVGHASAEFWAEASLRGKKVLQVATGRNHMAAIVVDE